PLAAVLEEARHAIALGTRADAAVARARDTAKLWGTAVEDTETFNFTLKGNPRIAGTAPAGLGTTVDGRGGETEGDVIVDGKG
ncbi:hypothetical protein BN1708_017262, partial [Verticillium longisporum]